VRFRKHDRFDVSIRFLGPSMILNRDSGSELSYPPGENPTEVQQCET